MNSHGLGNIADYKFPTTLDGEGIRGAIFVSGCIFNCDGCYNKKIQNFRAGQPFTDELFSTILEDMQKPNVDGLTLLGGEPFLNTQITLPLARAVKVLGKTVWSWTGYIYEDLLNGTPDQLELLSLVDILVDGQFDRTKFNRDLAFRGSFNQRIIDVKQSNKDTIVLWNNGNYLELENHIPQKL